MMTLQEVFDKAAKHLLTQGKRSVDSEGGCLYRGTDGSMCAVGCLISDEAYSAELEGLTVDVVCVREALHKSGVPMDNAALNLLQFLQGVHDCDPVREWRSALRATAAQFSLNTAALDEVSHGA